MLDCGILSWDRKVISTLIHCSQLRVQEHEKRHSWSSYALTLPILLLGDLQGKDDTLNWEVKVTSTKQLETWVSTVLLEGDSSHLIRFFTEETNKLCATFKSSLSLSLSVHSLCQLNVCRDTGSLCAEFSNAQCCEQLGYHLKRKLTHGQLVLVLCLRCVIASWNHPHKFSRCFSTSQPFGWDCVYINLIYSS